MKITKDYLRQVIKESLEEVSASVKDKFFSYNKKTKFAVYVEGDDGWMTFIDLFDSLESAKSYVIKTIKKGKGQYDYQADVLRIFGIDFDETTPTGKNNQILSISAKNLWTPDMINIPPRPNNINDKQPFTGDARKGRLNNY